MVHTYVGICAKSVVFDSKKKSIKLTNINCVLWHSFKMAVLSLKLFNFLIVLVANITYPLSSVTFTGPFPLLKKHSCVSFVCVMYSQPSSSLQYSIQSVLLPVSDPLSEKIIVSQICTWHIHITFVMFQGQFIMIIIYDGILSINEISLFFLVKTVFIFSIWLL